jgi:hypothetical protein
VTPEEVIVAAKHVLDKDMQLPFVAGVPQARNLAVERLVLLASAFFSINDEKLRDAIVAEAQNRIVLSKVIGRKPWDI